MFPFSIPPLFFFYSLVVIVSPGPDIIYVLAKGISQGRRAALIAALAFSCGLSVHTSLAAAGLSALLKTSFLAFTIVKLAGAAYLFYLGIRAFGSRGLISVPEGGQGSSGWQIFRQAFLMNVLNPKVAFFFLGFLPQFTRPELGISQFMLLGGCFAVLSLLVFSLAGVFSSFLGHSLRTRPLLVRTLDYAVGGLFVLLAIALALHRAPEPEPQFLVPGFRFQVNSEPGTRNRLGLSASRLAERE